MSLIYLISFYVKIFSSKDHKLIDKVFASIGAIVFCLYLYFLFKEVELYGHLNTQTMIFEMITFVLVMVNKFYLKKENNLERVFLILPFVFYNLGHVSFLASFVLFGDLFTKINKKDFGETSKKVFTIALVYTFLVLMGIVTSFNFILLLLPIIIMGIVLFERQTDYLLFSIATIISLLLRSLDGAIYTVFSSLYLLLVMAFFFYKDQLTQRLCTVLNNQVAEKLRVSLRTFFKKEETVIKLVEIPETKKDQKSQYQEMNFRYFNTIRSSMVLIFLVLSGISIFYLLHLKNLI